MYTPPVAVLDRLCARAWPALEQETCGGWVLRAANGISHRSNSVWARADEGPPIEERLRRAEEFYRARRLPPCFQVGPASAPADLAAILTRRGYVLGTPTMAMAAPLPVTLARAPVELLASPDDSWRRVFLGASQDDADGRGRLAIVQAMTLPRRHAVARVGDEPAAVGIGVVDGEWLGLYAMRTLAEHRRRGLARAVVEALFAWGAGEGARYAYLQVEVDNPPALELYRSLGFEEVYRYGYWLPVPGSGF